MTEFIKNYTIYTLSADIPGLTMGTAGREGNPIDYTADFSSIRKEEKKLISSLSGIDTGNIIFLNQTHEDTVITVDEHPGEDLLFHADADAIITPLPGLCPVIRTADCVPLFLFDVNKKILAAVHSGWRGSSLSIAAKAVDLMLKHYDCKADDISAFILPSIGPDAYEVQQDVARFFPCDITINKGQIHLNLWKNITDSLMAMKIPELAIFNARICTIKNNDRFFSHRRGDIQRNLNFAFFTGSTV
ncbi:MAG TPA: peptidoglycan editing factor PgeF [Spirochaetota bacterium]|nr:peptidoglycan editing factor PgeF [Spirochaetota bacterium]HPI90429.1 peptidoglycan editing factor PgeF [Spirochaetota bacterium]HPR46555.1 peptidoglycan editing factor PgeF [Spirochaetota bacterium]